LRGRVIKKCHEFYYFVIIIAFVEQGFEKNKSALGTHFVTTTQILDIKISFKAKTQEKVFFTLSIRIKILKNFEI
jgi:hypothetical protein